MKPEYGRGRPVEAFRSPQPYLQGAFHKQKPTGTRPESSASAYKLNSFQQLDNKPLDRIAQPPISPNLDRIGTTRNTPQNGKPQIALKNNFRFNIPVELNTSNHSNTIRQEERPPQKVTRRIFDDDEEPAPKITSISNSNANSQLLHLQRSPPTLKNSSMNTLGNINRERPSQKIYDIFATERSVSQPQNNFSIQPAYRNEQPINFFATQTPKATPNITNQIQTEFNLNTSRPQSTREIGPMSPINGPMMILPNPGAPNTNKIPDFPKRVPQFNPRDQYSEIARLERELKLLKDQQNSKEKELSELESLLGINGKPSVSSSLLSQCIHAHKKLKNQEAELKDLKMNYNLLKEETEKQRHEINKIETGEDLDRLPRTRDELLAQNQQFKTKIAQLQQEFDKTMYDKTLEIERKARCKMHQIAMNIAIEHIDSQDHELQAMVAKVRALEAENKQLEDTQRHDSSFA